MSANKTKDNISHASPIINALQQEQLAAQKAQAFIFLESDIVKWASGRITQQESAMNLGWDILTISSLDKKRKIETLIEEVVAKFRQHNETAADDGLSRPSIYRRTGIIMRIITNRAGLNRLANITLLRNNPTLLFHVKRDELPSLAKKYPCSHKLGKAFPNPSKIIPATQSLAANVVPVHVSQTTTLTVPAVTSMSVMSQIAKLHTDLAIAGMMLNTAHLKKLKFNASEINRLNYFKRASAQCSKACQKIVKAPINISQADLPWQESLTDSHII